MRMSPVFVEAVRVGIVARIARTFVGCSSGRCNVNVGMDTFVARCLHLLPVTLSIKRKPRKAVEV